MSVHTLSQFLRPGTGCVELLRYELYPPSLWLGVELYLEHMNCFANFGWQKLIYIVHGHLAQSQPANSIKWPAINQNYFLRQLN